MKIAICDDDDLFIQQIKTLICEQLNTKNDWHISIFNDGSDLLAAYDEEVQPFDLILLDIEMPNLNGIEAASQIRQWDRDVVIMLITGFKKYALLGYGIQAYHYLLKPINKNQFDKAFTTAYAACYRRSEKTLRVETRNYSVFIPYREIFYLESFGQVLTVHTEKSEYQCYKRLSRVFSELADSKFHQIHKSFVANLDYIRFVDKKNRMAVLQNNNQLPISKRRLDSLMTALLDIRR